MKTLYVRYTVVAKLSTKTGVAWTGLPKPTTVTAFEALRIGILEKELVTDPNVIDILIDSITELDKEDP